VTEDDLFAAIAPTNDLTPTTETDVTPSPPHTQPTDDLTPTIADDVTSTEPTDNVTPTLSDDVTPFQLLMRHPP